MKPFKCLHCGHTWFPRLFDPKTGEPRRSPTCPNPKCRCVKWYEPPRKKKGGPDQ